MDYNVDNDKHVNRHGCGGGGISLFFSCLLTGPNRDLGNTIGTKEVLCGPGTGVPRP
jgi:hypothetical protein